MKRLAWHSRWMRQDDPWRFSLDSGSPILLPHTGAAALIFYQGSSEPDLVRYLDEFLHPGMIFFDIGAHLGEFTLRAAKRVGPAGQVHSFEPLPEIAAVLRQSLTLAQLGNVTFRECAFSNKSGSLNFAVRSGFASSSIAGPASNDPRITRTIEVAVITLDEYIHASGAIPNLIKIDVEGAELLVLRGGEKLLSMPAERAAVICLEYSASNYEGFGFTTDEVRQLLAQNGYSLFVLDSHGTHPAAESELSGKEITNIVAMKKRI
jgi:FkbM family methyltransferase